MGWACGAYGCGEGVYRVLLGKPEGRRPLGRPRRRWVDNIRMNLQKVRCGYMDWIRLAQGRDRWRTLVSAVMNLRVPWNAGNFLTSCKPVSFSRRTLHHGVSNYWYSGQSTLKNGRRGVGKFTLAEPSPRVGNLLTEGVEERPAECYTGVSGHGRRRRSGWWKFRHLHSLWISLFVGPQCIFVYPDDWRSS